MKVLVYPRTHILAIKPKIENDSKVAIISINGFRTEHIFEDSNRILSLDFDDIDPNDNYPDKIKKIYHDLTIFNEDHAKQIIEFLKNLPEGIEYMICHCHAGVSRSGAVGTFISADFFKDDGDYEWFVFNNQQIVPNRHVVQTLLNVYTRDYSSKD